MNTPIQMAEIRRIAEQLDILCGDDEQCFADMLALETDVYEIVGKLHVQHASDGELVTGITERQSELAERKRRLTDRQAATKAAIGQFMRAAMLTKIELAEATYSVRPGKPTLRVVDPDAVPQPYCRTKVEPDKPAINAAYEDAAELPNWLVREAAVDVVTKRSK